MKCTDPPSPRPSAAAPTITGTCFCGAVAIEVAGAAEEMGYCHCTSCRAYSGAPLVAFTLWRSERVTVTHGVAFLGGFNKTGMSNRRFCTRCGGHFMAEHPGLGMTDVSAAVLPDLRFEPVVHLNYGCSVLPIRDGLPKLRDFPAAVGGSGEVVEEDPATADREQTNAARQSPGGSQTKEKVMFKQIASGLATVEALATAARGKALSRSDRRERRYSAAGPRAYAASLAAIGGIVAIIAVGSATEVAADVLLGTPTTQGKGSVTTYLDLSEDGSPRAIGVRFGGGALEGLPPARNNTSRCFDLDGNGQMSVHECEGDFELRLALPEEIAGRPDIPFSWVMLNWNPEGHDPHAWHHPHFDVHFYIMPQADLDQIAVGECGIFVDCAVFERARLPVPAQYVHADHISVDAVVGLMGNHLIDSKTPELNDPGHTFTHTWIFGAYDGEIIFYEVMLTRDHMLSEQSGCFPIKQPAAWQVPGWYPTSYCIRYDAAGSAHTVSMENFVLREASH